MKLRTDNFLRNGGHRRMDEAVTALVNKNPDALDVIATHVRESYVADPLFISTQVVGMWHQDESVHAKVQEMALNFSDAQNEIEFMTHFLSYPPLALAAAISLRSAKIHPKEFYLVCDHTELKPGCEAVALCIFRSMVERYSNQHEHLSICLQPALHHVEMGFRRQVFCSDDGTSTPSYSHHDLTAVYNHIYLFLN